MKKEDKFIESKVLPRSSKTRIKRALRIPKIPPWFVREEVPEKAIPPWFVDGKKEVVQWWATCSPGAPRRSKKLEELEKVDLNPSSVLCGLFKKLFKVDNLLPGGPLDGKRKTMRA